MVAHVMLQGHVQHRCGKGDAGVQLFLEDQRYALTEHVTQYPAKYAGNNRRDNGDYRAFSHI
ncbi:Uncharacterised protein [Kluyvera cryocrescens]|uniref:Uncharacterized protein n=1 Tax=Kluyvera cryocrescens TaxID=580 RepID=A0A485AK25_KLUCR|nr:Uncharacterised protein [Kluyvera cryocrescens]